MTSRPTAQRHSEGRRLLDLAGGLMLLAAVGLMVGDLTGLDAPKTAGLLGAILLPYYAALTAGFRGWPQQIVSSDPFRRATPGRRARLLAWPYATTTRVRCLGGVLTIVAVTWLATGLSAIA